MLGEKLNTLKEEALKSFQGAKSSEALYNEKVRFLGKNGSISLLMREMKNLSAEERPEFGKRVNEVKAELETVYSEKETQLKSGELSAQLAQEKLDMTLPGPKVPRGSQHPVHKALEDITEIFGRIGYSVRLGPLIERDYYNFQALNIPEDHPARDMQDTFYVDVEHVLRTHTSPVQIRCMEKEKPPIRIVAPGSVFRCDSDISHLPMFHQIEGLLVDKKVSMADLKGTLSWFNKEFFGTEVKTRFRPSFFPFTEPSAEIDCSCPLCNGKGCRTCGNSGWLEVGGCGLVHPNVFKSVGLPTEEWQGFAFGMGIERLAMIKYGVEDIRLYIENDTRFLEQFTP